MYWGILVNSKAPIIVWDEFLLWAVKEIKYKIKCKGYRGKSTYLYLWVVQKPIIKGG